MRSRHRWRLTSLLSPSGKSLTISISSSPLIAAHLWRSYCRTRFLSLEGSCLLLIHHSMSRDLSCIFLFLAITTCRSTYAVVSMNAYFACISNIDLTHNCVRKIPECFRLTRWKAPNRLEWRSYKISLLTSDWLAQNYSRKSCIAV